MSIFNEFNCENILVDFQILFFGGMTLLWSKRVEKEALIVKIKDFLTKMFIFR